MQIHHRDGCLRQEIQHPSSFHPHNFLYNVFECFLERFEKKFSSSFFNLTHKSGVKNVIDKNKFFVSLEGTQKCLHIKKKIFP